jgi:aminopeptidase N
MRFLIFMLFMSVSAFAQMPSIEPGVPLELARWRAARYSDVRYKLDLTLEKMSPVLKGTIEIRVNVRGASTAAIGGKSTPIVLDWRKIKGNEEKSTISNVSINGRSVAQNSFEESNEHLIFRDGVVFGENVITVEFTSPILTSGSAITRYVDKEDGAEYIYSLFVPSDASTAFPVFDQPDLKARFTLSVNSPKSWSVISNSLIQHIVTIDGGCPTTILLEGASTKPAPNTPAPPCNQYDIWAFQETRPISTYVFAFAAGPWQQVLSREGSGSPQSEPGAVATGSPDFRSGVEFRANPQSHTRDPQSSSPVATAPGSDSRGRVDVSGASVDLSTSIYVRKSQLAKFQPHAAEVFRLNREAVKYFEEYFDYKFPFPKYDLVLIPEFPFGGMEHAGATFLRESGIIFPQEPTKNDIASRATLIFHETAHQWFGDTVTMRWFDDLWLKEGFATFMAYKAMEKIMPEMNSWKVFYERIKQGAYQTDSTKGTTAIYQPIANLSAAKSAYGNIVYNKAPAFLRQAEFYLGEDKFQTAVRAFLRTHEYGNGRWEDLVADFARAKYELGPSGSTISPQQGLGLRRVVEWAEGWIKQRGLPIIKPAGTQLEQRSVLGEGTQWTQAFELYSFEKNPDPRSKDLVGIESAVIGGDGFSLNNSQSRASLLFPNYQDYGYGIFLLDDKSRDYILKNIQNEKDPFLRSMMWGALWDSVREGELDPKEYVELVIRNLSTTPSAEAASTPPKTGGESGRTRGELGRTGGESDESTIATLLGRVSTAMTYYLSEKQRDELTPKLEPVLMRRMENAPTLGQRITFYRAFLNLASSEKARNILKDMLRQKSEPGAVATGSSDMGLRNADFGSGAVVSANPQSQIRNPQSSAPVATAPGSDSRTTIPLKTKDRFDIVTKLASLGDPDAERLLADLEKTETSDDAKRYAYAARAAFPTKETKEKYWNDFVNNKQISESWIEAAFGPFNSVRHADLTLPYLQRALKELPNHKRDRKIFFVNGWLGAFIGGQRSEEALGIVNKFLADNPNLDKDLRLKILENVDVIERAVKIRRKFATQ